MGKAAWRVGSRHGQHRVYRQERQLRQSQRRRQELRHSHHGGPEGLAASEAMISESRESTKEARVGKVVKREKNIPGCEEYEAEAEKFLTHFVKFAHEQFGERCEDYEPECACCKMWHLYDEVAKHVDI